MLIILFSLENFFNAKISVADILTLGVIVLTYFTLMEVKRQRESMYIPDLFIGERSVDVFGFDFNHAGSFEYGSFTSKNQEEDKTNRSLDLQLKLFNIGFGSAKYVKIEWSYDVEKFIQLLDNTVEKSLFEFERNSDFGETNINIRHKDSNYHDLATYESLLKYEKNIVRPNENEENTPAILLPLMYEKMLAYYIAFKYESFDPKSNATFIYDYLKEIPQLFVKLTYSDIRNKKYTKKIQLNFHAMTMLFHANGRRRDFSAEHLWTLNITSHELND